MNLSTADFAALVVEANLAPSVHNTQPTRWRLESDGDVLVLEDTSRCLPIGDPEGRDTGVSHGAAIEGFALACASRGLAVTVNPLQGQADGNLRSIARLRMVAEVGSDPLQSAVSSRRTYRGAFAKADIAAALEALAIEADVHLVRSPDAVARLAELNDEASLRTFRDAAYRAELLSWMRLSRRDARWAVDGLNAEAMEMSTIEAAGAGFVLKAGVFEVFDRVGAASLLVGEAKVVRSASAIALFHRPHGEASIETGRRFYRFWLQVAALGLSAAPMAVLADDPTTRAAIGHEFGLPESRRLITAFRLGSAPIRRLGPKPRLPPHSLIV